MNVAKMIRNKINNFKSDRAFYKAEYDLARSEALDEKYKKQTEKLAEKAKEDAKKDVNTLGGRKARILKETFSSFKKATQQFKAQKQARDKLQARTAQNWKDYRRSQSDGYISYGEKMFKRR